MNGRGRRQISVPNIAVEVGGLARRYRSYWLRKGYVVGLYAPTG